MQGRVLNASLWFLAEPLPPVEPIAAPGLYCPHEPTVALRMSVVALERTVAPLQDGGFSHDLIP